MTAQIFDRALFPITVVWGREYVRFYAERVLASLLWPGNLPYTAHRMRLRYLLHVDEQGARYLEEHPNFQALRRIVEVEIDTIGDAIPTGQEKYTLAAQRHRQALERVAAEGGAMLLLSPDCVYSDGTLRHALGFLLDKGKRAVMSASLRAAKESFEPGLAARLDADAKPMTPRELLTLALGSLHPLSSTHLVDSPTFNTWPSHLYWRAGSEGILARCFHMHPLAVAPATHTLSCEQAMDNDYLAKACPDPDDIHIIDDSDDALGIEVSAKNQFDHIIRPNSFSSSQVAAWAREHANAQHHDFALAPVYFKAANPGVGFAAARDAAEAAMAEVFSRIRGERS